MPVTVLDDRYECRVGDVVNDVSVRATGILWAIYALVIAMIIGFLGVALPGRSAPPAPAETPYGRPIGPFVVRVEGEPEREAFETAAWPEAFSLARTRARLSPDQIVTIEDRGLREHRRSRVRPGDALEEWIPPESPSPRAP